MQIKNKLVFLSTLVMVAGAGCGKPYVQPQEQQPAVVTPIEQTNVDIKATYVSDKLGISFKYPKEAEGRLVEQGNEIRDPEWGDRGFIIVFDKKEDESIESAIEDVIKSQVKDPKNCSVQQKNKDSYMGEDTIQYMIIFISTSNPEIVYTPEEKERIKKADEAAKKDGGPFDGETEKQVIYNERVVAACSSYAQPELPSTSRNVGAWFLYNPTKSTTKFVYFPATTDPYFFGIHTIEFIKK